MSKIKVMSKDRAQQLRVISLAENLGAVVRDGDTSFVAGKFAVVIDTKKDSRGAILLSRGDFSPVKRPYDRVMSFDQFMNTSAPFWVTTGTASRGTSTQQAPRTIVETRVVTVEVPVGVCAQSTLKVTACDVLVQEAIGFKTLGLPFLTKNGVNVTMSEGVAYILDTVKNTATVLDATTASAKAKASILKDEQDVWFDYAQEFDLMTNVVLTKKVDGDTEGEDA